MTSRRDRGCIQQQNLGVLFMVLLLVLACTMLPRAADFFHRLTENPQTWAFLVKTAGVLGAGLLAFFVFIGFAIRRAERRGRSETQRRRDAQLRARAPGVHVRIRRRATTRRLRLGPLRVGVAMCTCCWSPVQMDDMPDARTCDGCGGLQHADCARWLGGCGRYGCGQPAAAARVTSPRRATP